MSWGLMIRGPVGWRMTMARNRKGQPVHGWIAGPLGPSPRIFGFGIAAFLVGLWLVKRPAGE